MQSLPSQGLSRSAVDDGAARRAKEEAEKDQDGSPQRNTYEYSPLPPPADRPATRMLRLLPSRNADAIVECVIQNYTLEPLNGEHAYEALSYVWGSPESTVDIRLDGRRFPVTTNLHDALRHLRNPTYERVLWVDAVCINQQDRREKERQIQQLASVFGFASCVLVWLGLARDESDEAFAQIQAAAAAAHEQRIVSMGTQDQVLKLLQRSWFRRMWVLQEVEAARQIVLCCGYSSISGHAFCQGIASLDLSYDGLAGLQALISSVTYLISGAIYRPRYKGYRSQAGGKGTTLPELIDMYHDREATLAHDKVYALLAMSTGAGSPDHQEIIPDYDLAQQELMQQLVAVSLGRSVLVQPWKARQVALIECHGVPIGRVVSAQRDRVRYDRQVVELVFGDLPESLHYQKTWGHRWVLQSPAKGIMEDDIVCLLHGASRPTLVRTCKDFFLITMVVLTPQHQVSEQTLPAPRAEPVPKPEAMNFLLVWDWENSSADTLFSGQDYTAWLRSMSPQQGILEVVRRELDMVKILHGATVYKPARARLESMKEDLLDETLKTEDSLMATYLDLVVTAHISDQEWEGAVAAAMRVTEHRTRVFGPYHKDTLDSVTRLALTYVEQCRFRNRHLRGRNLSMMKEMASSVGKYTLHVTEVDMMRIMEFGSSELLTLLVGQAQGKVPITQAIIRTAHQARENNPHWQAGNPMEVLLKAVKGTTVPAQNSITAILELSDERVVSLLLDKFRDQMRVSGSVVRAVAKNKRNGRRLMRMLLDESGRGHRLPIDESAVYEAVSSFDSDTIKLLFSCIGADITLREETAIKLIESPDETISALFLKYWGADSWIPAAVVMAALNNTPILRLLLDKHEGRIEITDEVMRHAETVLTSSETLFSHLLREHLIYDPILSPCALGIMTKTYFRGEASNSFVDQLWDNSGLAVTEDMVRMAARSELYGCQQIEFLLARMDRNKAGDVITQAVLKQAFRKPETGYLLLKLLLEETPGNVPVTMDMVTTAVRGWRDEDAMMVFVLENWPGRMNGDILMAVFQGAQNIMGIARAPPDRPDFGFKLPTSFIKLATLLKAESGQLVNTKKLFFDCFGSNLPLAPDTVCQCARFANISVMAVLVRRLVAEHGDIIITDGWIETLRANRDHGADVLEMLLSQRDMNIDFCLTRSGLWTMILFPFHLTSTLLHRLRNRIVITDNIMEVIIRRVPDASPLFPTLGPDVMLTTEAAELILKHGHSTDEQHLFSRQIDEGGGMLITQAMISASIRNQVHDGGSGGNAKLSMEGLLQRFGTDPHIVQMVVDAVAAAQGEAKIPFEVPLGWLGPGDHGPIIAKILRHGSTKNGGGASTTALKAMLTRHEDSHTSVSEEVISAVARYSSSEDWSILLEHRCGQDIRMTESVMLALVQSPDAESKLDTVYRCKRQNVTLTENALEASSHRTRLLLLNLWVPSARQSDESREFPSKWQRQKLESLLADFRRHGSSGQWAATADEALMVAVLKRACLLEYDNSDRMTDYDLVLERLWDRASGQDVVHAAVRSTSWTSNDMQGLLTRLGGSVSASITEDIIRAAASNKNLELKSLGHIINMRERGVVISPTTIIALLDRDEEDSLDYILDWWGDQLGMVTDEFLAIVVERFDQDDLLRVLDARKELTSAKMSVTEAVVQAASENDEHGDAMMRLLLDRLGTHVYLTNGAALEVARGFNQETVQRLVERLGDIGMISDDIAPAVLANTLLSDDFVDSLLETINTCKVMSEEFVIIAAASSTTTRMSLVLDRLGDDYDDAIINESTMEVAVSYNRHGDAMASLLINHMGAKAVVTESIMTAIFDNVSALPTDILTQFVRRWGRALPITEAVVEAAAGAYHGGVEALTMMIALHGKENLPMTDKAVVAAAATGEGVFEFICEQWRDIKITAEMLAEAYERNQDTDMSTSNEPEDRSRKKKDRAWHALRLLLSRERGVGDRITERLLRALARQTWFADGQVDDLILNRWSDGFSIGYEKLAEIAAEYVHDDVAMLRILDRILLESGSEHPAPGRIINAAARNRNRRILMRVCNRYAQGLKVTSEMVESAAANPDGKHALEFLVDRWEDSVEITEKAMIQAAQNPDAYDVLTFLYARWGMKLPVTDAVLVAAATNKQGAGAMDAISRYWGNHISPAQNVIKAAAENPRGSDVLRMIVWRWGALIPITEDIMLAVVRNQDDDAVLERILEYWGVESVLCTERVFEAIPRNAYGRAMESCLRRKMSI